MSQKDLRWVPNKPFSLDRFESYLQVSLEKKWLTNGGPLQAVLAEKLQHVLGSTRTIIPATSGTAALHALAAAWCLKSGATRWATQAFTFPSSIQGPLQNTLVCDQDPSLGGPSIAQLEEFKDRIDGVIVTNIFGLQCDVLAYEQWCHDNNKLLIFDNACTPIGFAKDGRCVHDIGDGSIVSLHETKPIGRGEGGALIVPAGLEEYVARAMNFGFVIDPAGGRRLSCRSCSNWKMSDIAAAAHCVQLDNILDPSYKERSANIHAKAIEGLKTHNLELMFEVQLPTIMNCLAVLLPPNLSGHNLEVIHYLNNSSPSIEAKRYYDPLTTYENAPVAWNLFDRIVCLPFHDQMTENEVSYMIEKLSSYINTLMDAERVNGNGKSSNGLKIEGDHLSGRLCCDLCHESKLAALA